MARQHLKIDPEAIDLIMAALVLSRQNRLHHAGHYAFLALGRILRKNLPEETGPTDFSNLPRRLELLHHQKKLPEEMGKQILAASHQVRAYLAKKVSFIPTYRGRKIKAYVNLIQKLIEEYSGIDFEDLIDEMTLVDLERLQLAFGDNLMKEEKTESFEGFVSSEFENLFELRDTLAALGGKLQEKMSRENNPLAGAQLSRTDYTSAYITLKFTGNPLQKVGEEAGFMVLLTNYYLSAGLYLGETARMTRERYWNLLLAEKLDDHLATMAELGGELTDTFWYYNLENRLPLADYPSRRKELKDSFQQRIAAGREKLETPSFSWNILLPIKVWSGKEVCALKAEVVDKIWEIYPPTSRLIEALA